MNKIATAIMDRLTDKRKLESVIDMGILVALVLTVVFTSLLLSIFQLSGAQSPQGIASAIADSQTTTAQTGPGHLTPVLALVGVMAVTLACAYYALLQRPS